MALRLLAEHHLGTSSLKVGCIGSSESTLLKKSHCWKPYVAAQDFDNTVDPFQLNFDEVRKKACELQATVVKP